MGGTCVDNICEALKPDFSISNLQNTQYSITIYLSDPSLNIGTLTLTNNGNDNAKNVIVTLSSREGYFEDEILDFDSISKGNSKDMDYSLAFTQKGLVLASEENDLVINAEVTYENSVNQEFSDSGNFDITVHGKNNVVGPYKNWLDNFSPWVTPNQNIVREFAAKTVRGLRTTESDENKHLAARLLFESMRAYGVNYVNERSQVGDYVQLPYETLKRKAGDCEDQAVLYASLLEAVGIKSAVIGIPGHALAGYYVGNETNTTISAVETTAGDFDSALRQGSTEAISHQEEGTVDVMTPQIAWKELPEVNTLDEPDIPLMDITKEVISTCDKTEDIFGDSVFETVVEFRNVGEAPGAGCIIVEIDYDDFTTTKHSCWTIPPGETTQKTLQQEAVFETDQWSCRVR